MKENCQRVGKQIHLFEYTVVSVNWGKESQAIECISFSATEQKTENCWVHPSVPAAYRESDHGDSRFSKVVQMCLFPAMSSCSFWDNPRHSQARWDTVYNLSSVFWVKLWASHRMDVPWKASNRRHPRGILTRFLNHLNWHLITWWLTIFRAAPLLK